MPAATARCRLGCAPAWRALKLAIVTGGDSGIGIEHARGLTAAGATVIVPARRPEEGLESVQAFANRFLASGRSFDLLINGAGIMAPAQATRVGVGGVQTELQFAVNHLRHFALTTIYGRPWRPTPGGGWSRSPHAVTSSQTFSGAP